MRKFNPPFSHNKNGFIIAVNVVVVVVVVGIVVAVVTVVVALRVASKPDVQADFFLEKFV